MSDIKKRQEEAEKFRKSLEEGLVKKKPNKRRKPSGKKGRTGGDKNLTSLGGGQYVNKFGVEFSESEREALRQAVNSVKRKQKRIMNNLDKYQGLKEYLTSNDGSLTGILGTFSTSMNQFETRQALDAELGRLNRMKTRGYELQLMERTRENYIKALTPSFIHEDPLFLQHIRTMPLDEFFKRRGSDLTNDFHYINSYPKPMDDIYMVQLMHSFGWLSPEERMNGDTAVDKYTGEKIEMKKVEKRLKQRKKAKKN